MRTWTWLLAVTFAWPLLVPARAGDKSLDQRVEYLERKVDRLDRDIEKLQKRIETVLDYCEKSVESHTAMIKDLHEIKTTTTTTDKNLQLFIRELKFGPPQKEKEKKKPPF